MQVAAAVNPILRLVFVKVDWLVVPTKGEVTLFVSVVAELEVSKVISVDVMTAQNTGVHLSNPGCPVVNHLCAVLVIFV
jgi:hypothetical protein